jgi:hypothetical protein
VRFPVARLTDLYAVSSETSSAVSQLLSAPNQQAQNASTQAASIVETASAGEEINTMARRNGEGSRQATRLMQRSQDRVLEAGSAREAW